MRVSTPHWGAALVSATMLVFAPSAHAATINVPAGGDLQAAINAAQPGDIVTLAPGVAYVGNFVLPNKGALTDYITIRSAAADSLLPGSNIRITPAYAAQLPKIYSPNSMSALRTAAGANHYRLMFLEFQANYKGYGDIVELGQGDATQTQLAQVPWALVVDRVYIHGDPIMGQKRGIALHSRDTSIVNSYIADCKAVGQEAQAISGFNGPGNFDIENNYLEASTQSFLMGGADPMIPNLVTTNITFRGNYLSKPIAWRGPIIATPANAAATIVASGGSLGAGTYAYKVAARVPAGQTTLANSAASAEVSATVAVAGAAVTISWTPVVGAADYVVYGRTAGGENMYWTTTVPYFTDTGTAGKSGTVPGATLWYVKNLFELKNAQDVLVEGNVMENLWVAAQPGYSVLFTPRNQGGTAPWVVVQRVTFQHNLVRHVSGVVNILGVDNINPSQRTNHIVVRDNVFDDVNTSWGSGARPFQLGDGPDAVTIDHNTVITNDSSVVWLYGGSAASPTPITNAVYTNNMSAHNAYGIMGSNFSSGLSSINAYLPGSLVAGNILAGGSASKYPTGNYFPTVSAWQANFADYAAGDYHLLATSSYKNAGTDGLDLGANVDVINGYAANALSGNALVAAGSHQVQITTSTLPDAMLNAPYSQAVACTGGSALCAWQVVTSLLPDGISFDAIHGAVSGTPTAVQTGNVTVTAYDPTWPTNSATATLTLTVDPPPFVLTVPAAPVGQVWSSYALYPQISGVLGSPMWSVSSGALPAGVGLDATSGAIAGTPTQWGTTTAVVQVTDSWSPTRVASQPVTITVAPAPLVIAAAPLAPAAYQQPYRAALSASGGTGSTAWSIVAGALPAGVSLDAAGNISGTPANIGAFTFTVQAVDANWPTNVASLALSFVVDAPAFSASLQPASAGQLGVAYQTAPGSTQGAVGSVTWTGWVPNGLVLNASTGAIGGTPTTVGSWVVTLQAHDSYDASRVASATETISIAPTAIAITTKSLPNGSVNSPYQAVLSATGGSGQTMWTLAAGGLPPGLMLSSSGMISGTPSAAGTASFTVRASDMGWSGNAATQALTIAVVETTLLDDRFDTLDRTKWPAGTFTSTQDYSIPLAATAGTLQIGPLKVSATGSHYNGIATAPFDLTSNGYAYVQLVQAPNTGTAAYAMFAAGVDANNFYRWYESGNALVAEKKIGGVKTTLATIPYDAAADQFVRIRTDVNAATGSRDVVFETAPNTNGVPGTFTVRYREPWDGHINVATIRFEIKAGTSDPIAAPGAAGWDNFHAARR